MLLHSQSMDHPNRFLICRACPVGKHCGPGSSTGARRHISGKHQIWVLPAAQASPACDSGSAAARNIIDNLFYVPFKGPC